MLVGKGVSDSERSPEIFGRALFCMPAYALPLPGGATYQCPLPRGIAHLVLFIEIFNSKPANLMKVDF